MKQEQENKKPLIKSCTVARWTASVCWMIIGGCLTYAAFITYPAMQLKLPEKCVVLYNYTMSLKAEVKDLGEKNQECVRVLKDTIEVCDEEAP